VTAGFQENFMYLLVLGLVLMAMKYLEFGPVAAWPWYFVLAPFALAVAWWAWADASGYTKRKVMEKENARRDARILRSKEAMGTVNHKKRR
jgi:small Trp-rich protein